MAYLINSDGQGNYFLHPGSPLFANHSINYPSVNYFKGVPHSEISLGLTDLVGAAGLTFRNVLSQADFDQMLTTFAYDKVFLYFGASGDLDDRYTFAGTVGDGNVGNVPTNNGTSACAATMYNDLGAELTGNDYDTRLLGLNRALIECGNQIFPSLDSLRNGAIEAVPAAIDRSELSWVGHATSKSLTLFCYQRWFDDVTNVVKYGFFHAGEPIYTNTNQSGYYSTDIKNRAIILSATSGAQNVDTDNIDRSQTAYNINAKHYIVTSQKDCLRTGAADFSIVCDAGSPPQPPAQPTEWSTGAYFSDNDGPKGDPKMCRMGYGIMATDDEVSFFKLGKPEKIVSTYFPEGYNNPNVAWLPVGHVANKTYMMMTWDPTI